MVVVYRLLWLANQVAFLPDMQSLCPTHSQDMFHGFRRPFCFDIVEFDLNVMKRKNR